jgi:hypothetical protein
VVFPVPEGAESIRANPLGIVEVLKNYKNCSEKQSLDVC